MSFLDLLKLLLKIKNSLLFGVTLFKKFQQEFITNAREHRWHPRTDFTYNEEVLNNLRKEFDLTQATEMKLKNDLIRLSKTAYLDIVASWFHIKVIRTYVEAVLRYGLPPEFDNYLIKFEGNNLKNVSKAKKELVQKFGYLGGDGFQTVLIYMNTHHWLIQIMNLLSCMILKLFKKRLGTFQLKHFLIISMDVSLFFFHFISITKEQ